MARNWTAKDERMYKSIKRSCIERKPRCSTKRTATGRKRVCVSTCERIAAATVNKHRAKRKR